jgi:hypothetical protein
MPLDTPDWQRDVDRAADPLVNDDRVMGTNILTFGPFNVQSWAGCDVLFQNGSLDVTLGFIWDVAGRSSPNVWGWQHNVPANTLYRVRMPNRGQRLTFQALWSGTPTGTITTIILPTARNDFGYEGNANLELIGTAGTIAANGALTFTFGFPYTGPAMFYCSLLSANGNMRLQRKPIGSSSWDDVAGQQISQFFNTLAVQIPAEIMRAILVNNAAASSSYSVFVVPSYQFA